MLMQNYLQSFREAVERTDALAAGMSNYPLKIDPSFDIDMGLVVAEIAKEFSEFLPHNEVLPGQCFRVARELSYILLNLGVRHAITIGDVKLFDGLLVGLTLDQLMRDVTEGYQLSFVDNLPAGKPMTPHVWITLENGVVVDATILASLHRKRSTPDNAISFESVVYYTGKPDSPVIQHMPMMTGFVYQQKVPTTLRSGDQQNYRQWY